MAVDRFLTRKFALGQPIDREGLVVSSGTPDAGRLVALDGSGKLDPSLLYPAGSTVIDYTLHATAFGALSGHRCIKSLGDGTVAYVDSATSGDVGLCVGITTAAALSGDDITYQANGTITFGGWAWSAGPVFIALNGQLSQTAPTSGFAQRVALALSATQILMDIGEPIVLA